MRNKFLILIPYKEQLKAGGKLFFIFLIVKSLIFFSPISISYILASPKLYGEFEYALNLGQIFMSFFSMGFGNAVAYFLVKEKRLHLAPAFNLHFAIISGFLLFISIIFPALNSNLIYGAIIIGAAFAYQIFCASVYKIEEKNIQSVFADSAIYFLMGGYAILLYCNVLPFEHKIWHLLVLSQMVISNILRYKKLIGFDRIKRTEFFEIYRYGIFIVIAGLALYALSNGTRVFLEPYTSYAEVGIYSYFFRIACLVVVIYRVIGIIMFKRYFISEHLKMDRFFSVLLPILFILNILIYGLLLIVAKRFPNLIEHSFIHKIHIYPLLIFQVNFWIGISLLEVMVYRELLSLRMFVIIVTCLLLFISTLWLMDNYKLCTLSSIIAVNTLFIGIGNFGQIYLLYKKGVFYKKTFRVQIAISFIFVLYLFFIYG